MNKNPLKNFWLIFTIGIVAFFAITISISAILEFNYELDRAFGMGFVIVIVVTIVGVVIASVVHTKLEIKHLIKHYSSLPEFTVQARVFDKTTDISGGGTSTTGDGTYYTDGVRTSYFVSFEFNNNRKFFEVDIEEYNTLKKNDRGVLTYREDENEIVFVEFERNSK
jgi:hypothetical protein